MKKILASLTIAMFTYFSANAQAPLINVGGAKQTKVCSISQDRKNISCYTTQYAENFKVCKSDYGYYICGETPGYNNSTYSSFQEVADTKSGAAQYQYANLVRSRKPVDITIPQSQSYVNTPAGSN